jgi:hypothetical protein
MIMRKLMLAAAVGSAAMVAALTPAAAQLAIETPAGGIYVGPNTYYENDYYNYDDSYGPRVYGYSYRDRGYHTRYRDRASDRQRCGRNAYWDGQNCVAGFRP